METGHSQGVAVVTGGGRGIGRAIALSLAEAGAAVAVVARTISEIAEGIDDDLDALLLRKDDIEARELYTLRIQT